MRLISLASDRFLEEGKKLMIANGTYLMKDVVKRRVNVCMPA